MKDANTTSEVNIERITHEHGVEDAWVCVCGNTPGDDGFYPCNEKGMVVQFVIGSDWANLYVCYGCGRIINQNTLEVVGQNTRAFGWKPRMLPQVVDTLRLPRGVRRRLT